MIRERIDRRFQVVAGKGGVGRTLVASSLAVRSARKGHRTLLVEVDASDSAAAQLGVSPAVDEPREVMSDLWLCRVTPPGALREYALMVLKFRALYHVVFENRLVKYLLQSIPSLGEFTMLGKTWYHWIEAREDGTPRFERIIVDAPATGHAVTFLSLARVVADVAPSGTMKDAAEKMAAMVEAEDSCLHVVSVPEEMPVNEGLELARDGQKILRMALGVGVMNRRLMSGWSREDRVALNELEYRASRESRLSPYVRAIQRHREREARQNEHAARFEMQSGLPMVSLPDFGGHRIDLQVLNRVVDVLERESGGTNEAGGHG